MQRTLKLTGIGLVVVLVTASLAVASARQPRNVQHPGSSSVQPAAKLKSYSIVHSGSLAAPALTHTHAKTTCPAGTKPLGGGAVIASGSLSVNLAGSYPSSSGWAADVNNQLGTPTTVDVYVICAKKPAGYKLVTASTSAPGNTQTPVTATCPTGTKILGGGGFTSSTTLLVNLNTTFPDSATSWSVALNNSGVPSTTASAVAVCGKGVTGWKRVTGTTVTQPDTTQSAATAQCPGFDVLGGGVHSSSASLVVDVNSSYPNGSNVWVGFENNGSAVTDSIEAYAICAKL